MWADNILFTVFVLELRYSCNVYIKPNFSIADLVHTVDDLVALMFFERE